MCASGDSQTSFLILKIDLMKRFLTEFFYYTRAERAGFLVLLVICVALFVAPWLWPKAAPEPTRTDDYEQAAALLARPAAGVEAEAATEELQLDPNAPTRAQLTALGLPDNTIRAWLSYTRKGGRFDDADALARFRALSAADRQRIAPHLMWPEREKRQSNRPARAPGSYRREATVAAAFPFDPNTATREALLQLGLPARIADNLIKYRERGGRFRRPEDLQKLYGLSPNDYERLAPYVTIAAAVPENAPAPRAVADRAPRPPVTIDINSADEAAWQQLRGIGPALSRRILRFRDQLGGFRSVEQVGETYGLPDSTFQKIRAQLQLGSAVYRALRINDADVETLANHPYIDYRAARAIVSYREQHGPFRSAADLSKVMALPSGTAEKLAPYLVFE
jgi:DNA uptake protein ComE-like DNA-binding protein